MMQQEVTDILQGILAHCKPTKVILYGVKENIQTHTIRSLDLCIIIPDGSEDTQNLRQRLYLCVPSSIPFQLLVYTVTEWADLSQEPTSYADAIQKKGTVLYEPKPERCGG